MANQKITQLPSASAASTTDVLPIVQGGSTDQITVENLAVGVFNSTSADSYVSKVTGSWSVPTGPSTQSFTVDWNYSYQMWVIGNIPNGIISWNANVNVTNANVPIVGSQYGWYYVAGNELVLTSIPSQIVGENGVISTTTVSTTTSNTFEFGITNNSDTTQTINWGYIKTS
jgi:hypothetical protein